MLDLMLGATPDSFSCGEAFGWFRPWESENLAVTPEHMRLRCSCGAMPCPVWRALRDVEPERFHRTVVDTLGVNQVIDSSKELRWVVDARRWASETGLRTTTVLIWKDPLELAYSWWKRGWLGEPDDRGQIDTRIGLKSIREFIDYHSELLEADVDPIAVSYSSLVNDPAQGIEQLCGKLGVPYVSGQERFWNKDHHFIFGSGTVRKGLVEGHGRIYYDEPSDEFRAAAAEFSIALQASDEVQDVLGRLKDLSVP